MERKAGRIEIMQSRNVTIDELSMDQALSNIEIIQVEKAENQSKILKNIDLGFFYAEPLISGIHKVERSYKRLNISKIIDSVKK